MQKYHGKTKMAKVNKPLPKITECENANKKQL